MFELIKKTMLAGVGLAAVTKDKVEELARELTEKGEMSEKEGRELIDELLKKSEQARKDLETKVEDTVRGFGEILEGKYDSLPEQAFYMAGGIEDVVEEAKKLGVTAGA